MAQLIAVGIFGAGIACILIGLYLFAESKGKSNRKNGK